MSLYTLSIRRPVLAIVMSITIVLFGLLGFSFLGVREFPSLDPPNISVSTSYRGASADVIESQITEPLEAAVNGVDGIRTLTSTSRDGRSTVQAEFDLGTDLERAANDIRDQVSRAMRDLPPDADPPIVWKADADARPIAGISVSSNKRNLLELSRLAQEAFVERLQTIPKVASVDIWGEKTYAMRLWIDPNKLAAHRLSPIDVRDAVVRENVELPSGRIEGEEVELPVRTMSRLDTPRGFDDLILKSEADRIVRLRDVGYAELGPRNERTVLKRDGIPVIYYLNNGSYLAHHMDSIDADVIGIDWRQDLGESRRTVGLKKAVQGNLDPVVLFASPEEIRARAHRIMDEVGPEPGHIFNLGHGILPQTPMDNAIALVEAVHEYRRYADIRPSVYNNRRTN